MVLRQLHRFAKPAMAGALAVVLSSSVFVGQLGAQTEPIASPVASPQSGDCVPGSGDATASAGAATPVPASQADATPVAADAADEVTAAADNVINCLNAGDVDGLVTLVTANLVQDKFGGSLPETLLPVTVLGYGEAYDYSDGRVGIQIVYLSGDYQYVTAIWVFVDNDGEYVLDEEALETSQPSGDTVVKGFALAADTPISFPQGGETSQFEVVSLLGTNGTEDQHVVELYYLGGPDAATPVISADDPTTAIAEVPSDATLVGSVSLAGGEIGDIVLISPAVGSYLLVDSFDGSVANVTITEPITVEI